MPQRIGNAANTSAAASSSMTVGASAEITAPRGQIRADHLTSALNELMQIEMNSVLPSTSAKIEVRGAEPTTRKPPTLAPVPPELKDWAKEVMGTPGGIYLVSPEEALRANVGEASRPTELLKSEIVKELDDFDSDVSLAGEERSTLDERIENMLLEQPIDDERNQAVPMQVAAQFEIPTAEAVGESEPSPMATEQPVVEVRPEALEQQEAMEVVSDTDRPPEIRASRAQARRRRRNATDEKQK